MQTLYVNMGTTDPFSEASVQCYAQRFREAEAAGIKVRALQISNPHNPSGSSAKLIVPFLFLPSLPTQLHVL